MSDVEDDDFWHEWLEKYKSFKCLWDPKVKNSSDKTQQDAWNELIEMAKIFNVEADSIYIRDRLQDFIYTFKLEAKKVEVAAFNGIKYEPDNFCYILLKDVYTMQDSDVSNNQCKILCEIDEIMTTNDEMKPRPTTSCRKVKGKYKDQERFWREVVKKWISFKCLWDQKNKGSYTTKERDAAYAEVQNLIRTIYPGANLAYVKNRIKYFRTMYNRELKRSREAQKNGLQYISNLYFFDLMAPLYEENEDDNTINSTDAELELKRSESQAVSTKTLINFEELNQKQQFWTKVILKYVSFKCLWDRETQKYTSDERIRAWHSILKLIRKFCPDADLHYAKNRIKNFRTVYVREMKQIKKGAANGSEYKSNIYYLEYFHPIYQKDCPVIEYISEKGEDESDSGDDLEYLIQHEVNKVEKNDVKANKKYAKIVEELESKGFIYGPFETKHLTFDKRIWLKFIRKYVALQCLWDHKNRDQYKDYERDAAWQELVLIAKTLDPKNDLKEVKRRMKSFRSVYAKRLREAKKEGKQYVNALYYFNALSPVYQEGFPIFDTDDNDDVVMLNTELNALNPKSSTYFPDDDDDDDDEKEDSKINLKSLSEKDYWLKFLKKYMTFKCLWDYERNKLQYSQQDRIKAYKILLDIIKPLHPEADLNFVKKHLKNFRSEFEKDWHKLLTANENGNSFTSSLYYFDILTPIYQKNETAEKFSSDESILEYPVEDNQETVYEVAYSFSDNDEWNSFVQKEEPIDDFKMENNSSINESMADDVDFKEVTSEQNISLNEDFNTEYLKNTKENPLYIPTHKSVSIQTVPKLEQKRKRSRKTATKEGSSTDTDSECKHKKSDQFKTFEKRLTQHLESMNSDQYLFAEKIITDVCFYGRLKKLTYDTSFILKKT